MSKARLQSSDGVDFKAAKVFWHVMTDDEVAAMDPVERAREEAILDAFVALGRQADRIQAWSSAR